MLTKWENKVLRKYGHENWRTIATFHITTFLKKFCEKD